MSDNYQSIFKQASRTHFYASLFFPNKQRLQVNRLYAFVRRADDLVDNIPQLRMEFLEFRSVFDSLRHGRQVANSILQQRDIEVIQSFVDLEKELSFVPDWADSFLHSMELDLYRNSCENMDQTMEYIYGSASVIGLFMSRILGLSDSFYPSAISLGQSFQYINFIRDINEDIGLGRCYFPATELQRFGLLSLNQEETQAKPEAFRNFVKSTIDQYRDWQKEAMIGIKNMPKKYAVAIKTASDMYSWTADQIARDPFVVYTRKIKPSKWKVLFAGLGNLIRFYLLPFWPIKV